MLDEIWSWSSISICWFSLYFFLFVFLNKGKHDSILLKELALSNNWNNTNSLVGKNNLIQQNMNLFVVQFCST